MLKQLQLQVELKQRQLELAGYQTRQTEFKTRQADLTIALGEATTTEDTTLVEDKITELDKDVSEAGIDEKVSTVEAEIERINGELAEIETRTSTTTTTATTSIQPQQTKTNDERGAYINMKTRGIFGSITMEQRTAIVERAEVKDFLQRVREFKGQSRSVTGAELQTPPILLELLKDNLHKYSKLISKVNLKSVAGKARQTIGGTTQEAIWTEMVANLNEMSIAFTQVEVDGYKVGGFIAIPNSTLDDSDINLAAEILEALAQGIGLATDKAIIFGTGVRMPLGIATRLVQTAQPTSWGANAPAWTDLHTSNVLKWDSSAQTAQAFFASLFEKLSVAKSNYSNGQTFWVMNSNTKMKLISKAITFDSAGALVSGMKEAMPFIGGEIITLDFIADNDIIGGYGSLYLLAERQGIVIENSKECRFLQDQTVFKGVARYDGCPVFGEGFVIVNFANTTPTTTNTFAGDEANQDLVSLSALTIGATPITLYPPFSKDVLNYHASVAAHSQKLVATVLKTGATAVIKNGTTVVTSGANATLVNGENTITVEITNGNSAKRTYTVIVADSAT